MALADEKGVAGVTMRTIAGRLGVEAMSLYNHVAGRDDILDGMVDAVFSEIELPAPIGDWKRAMRDRAARRARCYGAIRGRSACSTPAASPARQPCGTTTPCWGPCAAAVSRS